MKNIKIAFFIVALSGMLALNGCGGGSGGPGAPAAAGSAVETTVATVSVNQAPAPAVTGMAKMAWDAPTNADGTPMTDLAGYRVCYGTEPGAYTTTVDVGPATSCSISDLAPGRYYFAVTAYDASGAESGYSNEATKDIQG